jgi:predicted  nucleic acid-binding Zn-ribbon protein
VGALQDLLALQDIDLQIDQAQYRRDHLPERAEASALDTRAKTIAAEMAANGSTLGALAARQDAAEAELATTEERIAAIDKRLYSGAVSATKDLQAMTAEIDHLRERVSGMEDGILLLLDERAPLESALEQRRHELESVTAAHAEATIRLAEAEAEVERELKSLRARRHEAAASVPADLTATYERLRSRLGGIGVARVVGNHCYGCHLTLSAVEVDQLRHLPEGEIYTCEQCSRILVP